MDILNNPSFLLVAYILLEDIQKLTCNDMSNLEI